MKNNLHIFGCSHSYPFLGVDAKLVGLNPNIKFWGNIIADTFGLDMFSRTGQVGRNVEYILFDIFDRIMSNKIKKNDLVILNTSYPLRFGTPRLQSYSKHPMDYKIDLESRLNMTFDDMESLDDLKPEITFILWYVQTFGAWKILSLVCDNVYQWSLSDTDEMNKLYRKCRTFFLNEPTKNLYNTILGISWYDIVEDNFFNPWDKLLLHPIESRSWNDWILSHRVGQKDSHLHPNHYNEFAKLFIEQIKY